MQGQEADPTEVEPMVGLEVTILQIHLNFFIEQPEAERGSSLGELDSAQIVTAEDVIGLRGKQEPSSTRFEGESATVILESGSGNPTAT